MMAFYFIMTQLVAENVHKGRNVYKRVEFETDPYEEMFQTCHPCGVQELGGTICYRHAVPLALRRT